MHYLLRPCADRRGTLARTRPVYEPLALLRFFEHFMWTRLGTWPHGRSKDDLWARKTVFVRVVSALSRSRSAAAVKCALDGGLLPPVPQQSSSQRHLRGPQCNRRGADFLVVFPNC